MIEQAPTTILVRNEHGTIVTQFNCRFVPTKGDVLTLVSDVGQLFFEVQGAGYFLDADTEITSSFNRITLLVKQVATNGS